MTDSRRSLLDRHWRELYAAPVSAERRMRVSHLPIATSRGNLAVAVDHDGYRHLLVPIASNQAVRRGLNGPTLVLSKRPLEDENTYQMYADLSCLRADLNDLFTMVCADVLKATEALPDNPLKVLHRVLDRWKALFQTVGAPLGQEQMAGLFGELLVLVQLLQRDSSAHRLWSGPEGHPHDFTGPGLAVEVKSSTAAEGRRVRIHGLEQLGVSVGETLLLVWFRLKRDQTSGQGVVELVERALQLCDDDSALISQLSTAGYRLADVDFYRETRFTVSEERWYAVDASFPKLTVNDLAAVGVPVGVTDVAYTIDLSGEIPEPLDEEYVQEHLDRMVES
ncbi:PD-(D/E)XK motif protein [Amycolatopsis thermoflava]|uniref:PD-(D/E)XK motif protein n=1 Tax=Amycolatopsis thermoflava TaxID=84480 RepID=UPI0038207471